MTQSNIPRKAATFELIEIAGPAGKLECLRLDSAWSSTVGIALIAHPNPTEGGTFNNKIVHTLAKTLSRLGYVAFCPNLRGVGKSEGVHSRGEFEPDDMAAVLAYARSQFPEVTRLTLAGFSFGTLVQSRLRERLGEHEVEGMILIGPAVSRYEFPNVPKGTLIIHGEEDEVISLQAVLDWARPQQHPVVVVPGVGHFFHGRLTQLGEMVDKAWRF
ncbi:alpha/beta fold hydrolase [Chitinibacter bivalviorum]|uniref:Alpha/beta fold hydrolase n=1 Tax=Chitinibacter bivalviorum TaxID=2739434 RepID=A0A7H9BHS7_9NEIS|nr:alpha/beta fold hydrolase [Chitinibacter bivalviorum]QLG87826.1 alpha/beta fold hydrolase [Chitinibacter bivalviorum]